ncbi:MAG: hypothetical protein EOP49_50185, partial [Sphingobacteriales bacterium]
PSTDGIVMRPDESDTFGQGEMVVCLRENDTQYRDEMRYVHEGSLKNGRISQVSRRQVIKGWTIAVQQMSVGSKWRLFLPPAMAYGDRGAGGMIGPKSTLIFEVELLSFK